MIICHCYRIGHRDVARACAEAAAENPGARMTASAVFNALGVRPRCGRCAGSLAQFIREHNGAGGGAPARCCSACARDGDEAPALPSQELPAA